MLKPASYRQPCGNCIQTFGSKPYFVSGIFLSYAFLISVMNCKYLLVVSNWKMSNMFFLRNIGKHNTSTNEI